MPRATAIGGDPAMRHGVFALAQWELGPPKPKLLNYDILYSWTKKDDGVTEKSTLNDIQRVSRTIVAAHVEFLDMGKTYPVGVDWTSTTGFMGRRRQASVQSFFMGYLIREFEAWGFPVIVLTPQDVRQQLGLGHNVPKETVWHELRAMMDPSQTKMKKSYASDLRDALILSYLTAVGRSRNEAGQSVSAGLSGRKARV